LKFSVLILFAAVLPKNWLCIVCELNTTQN
jgi:hypothetical protein